MVSSHPRHCLQWVLRGAALGVSGLPSSLCGTRVKTREVFAEMGLAAPSVLLGHLAGQGM